MVPVQCESMSLLEAKRGLECQDSRSFESERRRRPSPERPVQSRPEMRRIKAERTIAMSTSSSMDATLPGRDAGGKSGLSILSPPAC